MKRNQKGFTLIEIIAVLVILGILAAVAIPKYLDIQNEARVKAAKGQIAEVKGRLSSALAGYMLSYSGAKPAGGSALVTWVNAKTNPDGCPTSATVEGDFTFSCAGQGGTRVVTITVSAVQGNSLTPSVTGTFSFSD